MAIAINFTRVWVIAENHLVPDVDINIRVEILENYIRAFSGPDKVLRTLDRSLSGIVLTPSGI